jgi:hypothetical protein
MIEYAHEHGGRIELNAGPVENVMGDAARESEWVSYRVSSNRLIQACLFTLIPSQIPITVV